MRAIPTFSPANGIWAMGSILPTLSVLARDWSATKFYYPPGNVPSPNDPVDPKTTDYIADQAVRFIEANKDRPFFAYLPFQAVHIPIGARADLVAKYRQEGPDRAAGCVGQRKAENKVRLVQNHAEYAAMLEQMDSAIGRVLDALDALRRRRPHHRHFHVRQRRPFHR